MKTVYMIHIALRQLSLAIIAGTLVTFGIAVALISLIDLVEDGFSVPCKLTCSEWGGDHYFALGSEMVFTTHLPPGREVTINSEDLTELPRWSRATRDICQGSSKLGSERFVVDEVRGWPARFLLASHSTNYNGSVKIITGFEWGMGKKSRYYTRVLPNRILWLGLLINISFWGATSWLFFNLMIWGRRSFRKRRGCCSKCGYNLLGKLSCGCPECGWGRDDTSTQAKIKES